MAQQPERIHDGRPAGSAAEDVGDTASQDIRIASRPKAGWWGNAGLLALVALVVIGLYLNLPPFRTLATAKQVTAINTKAPVLDYTLIAVHIVLGIIALVTMCLAIWPWLRVRHPALHRRSFRLYLYSAMPCSLLILPIVYLHTGLPVDFGSYTKGTFWFIATLVAYIATRQGNADRQRRWRLYSFAVCASVLWSQFVGQFVLNTESQFSHLMEVVGWADPLINLLIVKAWMYYTERRDAKVRPVTDLKRDQAYPQAA